jgi:TonB family protein
MLQANPTQGANSLDLYIKKIHSVFEMHEVAYGAPEHLPAFVAKLRNDRHLAMDFWALTAAISRNEGDSFSNEQMLNVIVRGTTGKDTAEVRESDEETKHAVEDLYRLLSGEDIDNPLAEPEEPWPPQQQVQQPQRTEVPAQHAQRKHSVVPLFSRIHSIEISKEDAAEPPADELAEEPAIEEAISPELSASPVPEEENETLHENEVPHNAQWLRETDLRDDLPSAASPTLSRKALDEALLQLERNSRLLKRHLERIDRRMSRLEPRLQELAEKASSNPNDYEDPVPAYLPHENDLTFDSSPHRARSHGKNPRLVLLADDVDDDRAGPVPLENYAPQTGRGIGKYGWFALLLLLGGGVFVAQHWFGATLRREFVPRLEQTFHKASDQFANDVTNILSIIGQHKKNESNPNSGSVSSTNTASSTANTNSSPAPAPAPTQQSQPAEASDSTPAPSSPAQPSFSIVPFSATADSRSSRTGRSSENSDYVSPSSTADLAGSPVPVPSSVMQENLVTSRVPAYPEAAKADGVEGPVVMQALISKYGTVDRLHVIQGDPILRGAASEAVSKWHYRPYTVNGRPVEVATTVKVEFKLPRR